MSVWVCLGWTDRLQPVLILFLSQSWWSFRSTQQRQKTKQVKSWTFSPPTFNSLILTLQPDCSLHLQPCVNMKTARRRTRCVNAPARGSWTVRVLQVSTEQSVKVRCCRQVEKLLLLSHRNVELCLWWWIIVIINTDTLYYGNQSLDVVNNCFIAQFISLPTRGSALSRLKTSLYESELLFGIQVISSHRASTRLLAALDGSHCTTLRLQTQLLLA